jgi:hypothetical protein
MRNINLSTAGATCAVLTTLSFVVGVAFSAGSGVQTIIPDTGKDAIDWINDVNDAGGPFLVGAWSVILGGFLGLLALIGFWEALRDAGRLLILAPILAVVGFTLVQISHLIPIAMAYELVPDYVDATGATKASIASTADMFAVLALVLNYAGDVVLWGVVVPMYAYAALKTRVVGRWIGWLGFVVAFFAGWLGAFAPASDVIDGITFIGFVGFFVWMAAMGVSLLLGQRAAASKNPHLASP